MCLGLVSTQHDSQPLLMPYKDKTKQRGYQNEWITKRRRAWIDANGGKCRKCGSTEKLCVSPVNRTRPTHRIWTWKFTQLQKELVDCEVLCWTCQSVKNRAKGDGSQPPPQHGTVHRYRLKCRCLPCCVACAKERTANRLRNKERTMDKKKNWVNPHNFGEQNTPTKRCKRCGLSWQRRKEACVPLVTATPATPVTPITPVPEHPRVETEDDSQDLVDLLASTALLPEVAAPFEGDGGQFGGGGASSSWDAPDTSSDSSSDSGGSDYSSSDSGSSDSGGGGSSGGD